MGTDANRAAVRLTELWAVSRWGSTSASGGQPMEHVLIALCIAERLGLDDETRAVVYYTGSHAPMRAVR